MSTTIRPTRPQRVLIQRLGQILVILCGCRNWSGPLLTNRRCGRFSLLEAWSRSEGSSGCYTYSQKFRLNIYYFFICAFLIHSSPSLSLFSLQNTHTCTHIHTYTPHTPHTTHHTPPPPPQPPPPTPPPLLLLHTGARNDTTTHSNNNNNMHT